MKELTIWTATKDVTSVVSSIVSTFRSLHIIRKEDSIKLKNRLKNLETIAKAEGLGELARVNIREIAKTQEVIDRANLTGIARELAIKQLEELSNMLEKNVREFLK